jgi:hypothetical protein
MKYSIRGNLNVVDPSSVVSLLNTYTLWRLETRATNGIFTFEVWVNVLNDKNSLFDQLKPYVIQIDDFIDWHECTHDEESPQPCVISEVFRR